MKKQALAVILSLTSAVSFAAFSNGNFEGATLAPWQSYQAGTPTQIAGARTGGSGTKIVQFSGTGTATPSFYQGGLTEIGFNQTWRARCWIRWTAGTQGTANFGFWGTQSPYGPSNTNALVPPTTTSWTQVQAIKSWPAANYADGYRDIQVSVTGISGGCTIQMDDVELNNITAVSDWSVY